MAEQFVRFARFRTGAVDLAQIYLHRNAGLKKMWECDNMSIKFLS